MWTDLLAVNTRTFTPFVEQLNKIIYAFCNYGRSSKISFCHFTILGRSLSSFTRINFLFLTEHFLFSMMVRSDDQISSQIIALTTYGGDRGDRKSC